MNKKAPSANPRKAPPKPATVREFDWDLVQSFLAVLDTGSLLAASRQLKTTQPTVGRHIEAFESQLGLLLFDRTARGLVPTAHAHQIAAHSRVMQQSAHQLASVAVGQGVPETSEVRLSASEMIAHFVLPDISLKLAVQAPNIRLVINSSDAVVNLLRRDADIAIRMVKPTQSSLIARRLGEVRLLPCAAQSHIDRWGIPRSLPEAMRQPLVMPDQDTGYLAGMKRMGLSIDDLNVVMKTDCFPVAWKAISSGLGIGVSSEYMIDRTPHVHRLPIDFRVPPLQLWLAVHRELRSNAGIREVFDFLGRELMQIVSKD
ncbi:MAG: LysR family transcriptional regulator [Burkholderiaceae bacterium]